MPRQPNIETIGRAKLEKIEYGTYKALHWLGTPTRVLTEAIVKSVSSLRKNTQVFNATLKDVDFRQLTPQNSQIPLAVILSSTHQIESVFWLIKFLEIYTIRRSLKKKFGLSDLEIALVFGATREDLNDVLNNPRVQHVVVSGHGTWKEWIDSNAEPVTNRDLELEEGMPKKESFVRVTCGEPLHHDKFDDQLGTPFTQANNTFGRSRLTTAYEIYIHPLACTNPDEFERKRDRALYRSILSEPRKTIEEIANDLISLFGISDLANAIRKRLKD